MKGITIKLPEMTLRQLRQEARATGRSVAEIVRGCLENRSDHTTARALRTSSLRSDFETDGRCKRSLAAIEGHELFDSHQFRCRNMDNVQTPRTVDRGMFFAEARRQAQNGRPFDCRSDQSSAMQVFWDIFPRGCRLSIRQQLTKDSELKCISYF